MPNKIPIEEFLIEKGLLTRSQLRRAVRLGRRESPRPVEDILVGLGYMSRETLTRCAGERDHVQVVDLDGYKVDSRALRMVSDVFARHNHVIPIGLEEDKLVVAGLYPLDYDVMDETATMSGMEVKPVMAIPDSLERAIELMYGGVREAEEPGGLSSALYDMADCPVELRFRERVESAPVVRMVNAIIEDAYRRNASDIHVEPRGRSLVIRIRINGDLIVHTILMMEYHHPMVTRLKLMAGMDIAEKRIPQDGKYHYERGDASTDLRISTLPTIYGEKVVLRLLSNDRDNSLMDVRRLGMEEKQLEVFERILKAPHGIVLVTGPTGSGKTTTLYALLNRLVKKKVNIVTVEDPVEKVIEGITQVQVNPKAGLTFATALRSILRQDPDVIMVGEMRDEETVSIGVRAAITGHLVLSTLHTNDCASTINRLRDMGAPSYMVAAALSGIVAQRLVKMLCPCCRQSCEPDARERQVLKTEGLEAKMLWKPVGCPHCNGTGYDGRKAIYEMIDVDEPVKSMITENAPIHEIRSYQKKQGFRFLKDYAMMMVLDGKTSMEEAEKIIYSVE